MENIWVLYQWLDHFILQMVTYLNGKVYMVQNDKLPFAALHGDPDILENGKTRFGPTALALLVLERYKGGKSIFQCLKTLKLMEVFENFLGFIKRFRY
jgi:malate dehydrogenase (quinone)